jgi:hypothetical protein
MPKTKGGVVGASVGVEVSKGGMKKALVAAGVVTDPCVEVAGVPQAESTSTRTTDDKANNLIRLRIGYFLLIES